MSLALGGLQTGGATAGVAITPASVTVNPGTAAAPTVNFTGDTTTGLYRAGAGLVGFSSAGTASLYVGANGLLGSSIAAVTLTMNAAGWTGVFGANSVIFDATHFAWRPNSAELAGWTAAGSLRSGLVAIPDASGTPGNATQNAPRGKAAFAAAASTCVITNSEVTANSVVMVVLETATDATLLYIRGVAPAAGSFTVTANAAATGTVIFRWFIVK